MKKIFTLITLALMAVGVNAQTESYAVPAEFTPTSNLVVEATASVKLEYGKDNGWKQSGTPGEADPKFEDFPYYVVGTDNPKNSADKNYSPGNASTLPVKGTTYSFTPSQDGTMEVAVKLNSGKNFYIAGVSDAYNYSGSAVLTNTEGTVVELSSSFTVSASFTGFVKFDVKKDETYIVFCSGSKLSFFGFKFTPGEVIEDTGTPHEPQAWDFTSKLSDADKANIAADENWSISNVYVKDEDGNDTEEIKTLLYSYTQKFQGVPVTANGTELDLTKGLKFTTGANKFQYYDGERLAHGGNGHGPIVTDCAKDDVVKIRYKVADGDRGFEVGNAELIEGKLIADEKGTFEATVTVKKKGEVTFSSVTGADILALAVNTDLPDITDGISSVKTVEIQTVQRYNIAGQKVSANYKGITIQNGRKVLQK